MLAALKENSYLPCSYFCIEPIKVWFQTSSFPNHLDEQSAVAERNWSGTRKYLRPQSPFNLCDDDRGDGGREDEGHGDGGDVTVVMVMVVMVMVPMVMVMVMVVMVVMVMMVVMTVVMMVMV